jgi:hypothetical protein
MKTGIKHPEEGTIKLMDNEGYKVLREETYYSASGRSQIIERWKKLYPSKEVLILHICPKDGELKIRESKNKAAQIAPEASPIIPKISKRQKYKPIGGGINSISMPKPSQRTHYF